MSRPPPEPRRPPMQEIREGRIDPPPFPPCQIVERGYLPGWSIWILGPLVVLNLIVFLAAIACH